MGGFTGGILVQRPIIQDAHSLPSNGPTLRDDVDSSSSYDSTQPPDVVFETEFSEQVETIGSFNFCYHFR